MRGGYSLTTPSRASATSCSALYPLNLPDWFQTMSVPSPDLAHPRAFDLIAFDWDGTLFDSTQIIVRCIQEAVVDVGGARPSDEAAAYVIGMALMQALAHAAPDVPPEKYPELGNRYRYHYIKHQDELALFKGVLPMLDALKARQHLLTVATGKSRRGLDEALHTVELAGMFDGSRTADETAGKPHPTPGRKHGVLAMLGREKAKHPLPVQRVVAYRLALSRASVFNVTPIMSLWASRVSRQSGDRKVNAF